MLYPFSRLYRPARSPASGDPALDRKRGFNLIESAIVLGVVGLVIGGIWVAASAVNEEWKVSKTTEDIAVIVRKIQNLISFADAAAIGNEVNITATIRDAGIFPSDWVVGSSVKNDFRGAVTIISYVSPPRFNFYLYGIPRSACVKIVVKVTSAGANTGAASTTYFRGNSLGFMYVNSAGTWSTSTFPVSVAAATVACNQETNLIMLTFGYTRIN
jgi:type II secretory pathway pseudopilin PulG